MKVIGYSKSHPADHSEALIDAEQERPVPGPRDVLVEVKAIAVNPVDTKIRQRAEPEAGQLKIIGWDAAGVVTAVGDDVTLFHPGDEVWYAGDLTRAGCNAEYQLVDERLVGRKPRTLSFAEAAAMPLTTITAWEMLFDRLQVPVKGNARLLITGAAGGVGSIMIQLAKALTDATVIATASRTESKQWVKDMGADIVLDHSNSLVAELAAATTELTDVSHVASLTHTTEHFADLVTLLQPQGRFALIDDPTEPLDIMSMKQKSLSLHWEFMFTRSKFQTDDMEAQHALLNKVAEMVDAGQVKTTIGQHLGVINAANLKKAHQQLESAKTIGKLVLEGFDN